MIWLYPAPNPVAFSVGTLTVHWYGLFYLISFILGSLFLSTRRHLYLPSLTTETQQELLFFMVLGVVFGGRVGYVLFYHLSLLWTDPLFLLRLWEPGMSFHGGLLGVILALFAFARQYHLPFLAVSDFIAPAVPIGLGLGRVGNFINGELWGRPTHTEWGMVFPHVDTLPRHPAQWYEALLEGLLLFTILFIASRKKRPLGQISALFLMGYALVRFIVEFYREPDAHLGFIAFHWLTMGQLLSIPLFIVGAFIGWRSIYGTLSKPHAPGVNARH